MESRFGYDFTNVRIYNNDKASKSAKKINSLAYTYGKNIIFNQGQYPPKTVNKKKILAHELVHIIQNQNSIMRQSENNLNQNTFDYWSLEDDDDVMELTDLQLSQAPPEHKSRMIKLLLSGATFEDEEEQAKKILSFANQANEISLLNLDWEDVGDELGFNVVRNLIGNLNTALITEDEDDILLITTEELSKALVSEKSILLDILVSGYTNPEEENKILEILMSEPDSTAFNGLLEWTDILSEIGWKRFSLLTPVPEGITVADIDAEDKIGIALEKSPEFIASEINELWQFFKEWFLPLLFGAIAVALILVFVAPPAVLAWFAAWLPATLAVIGPLAAYLGIGMMLKKFASGIWEAVTAETEEDLVTAAKEFASGITDLLIEVVTFGLLHLAKFAKNLPWLRRFLQGKYGAKNLDEALEAAEEGKVLEETKRVDEAMEAAKEEITAPKPPEPTTKPPEPTTKPPEPTTKPPEPTTKPPEPTTKPPEKVESAIETPKEQPSVVWDLHKGATEYRDY